MSSPTLLTIGDATLDTFMMIDKDASQCSLNEEGDKLQLNYGEKICVEQSEQSVGGNAANVAIGVKKLGISTAIYTELGADITGRSIKHELAHCGVDTTTLRMLDGKQSRFSLVLNYLAERSILSFHAQRAYHFPELEQLPPYLYYTSLGKSFEGIQEKIIQLKTNHPETKLIVNPGSYQLGPGFDIFKKILPHTDILFVNKEEAFQLADVNTTITDAAKVLASKGITIVIITNSTEGSYCFHDEQLYHLPIFSSEAIAKTGAGDAYASGFLAAHILGNDIPTAMRWGTMNADQVVKHIGAHNGLCSLEQLQNGLKDYDQIQAKQIS